MLREKFVARFILLSFFRQTVREPVKFHGQFRAGAIKIQDASSQFVLPSKFEAREFATAQCLPELPFLLCLATTQ